MHSARTAGLSRRERQIMDILYRRGRATGAEVMQDLPDPLTYSTVRTQLRVLERKGHVRHEDDGVKFVYMPAEPRSTARRSALKHLIETFFDGSVEKVVSALLGGEAARISGEELDRIAAHVTKAKSETRPQRQASRNRPEARTAGTPEERGRR